MEIPLKKIKFTLFSILLFLIAIHVACSTSTNRLETEKDSLGMDSLKREAIKKEEVDKRISERDLPERALSECIPKDTILTKTDMSVKYVIQDTSYTLQIQIHKTKKLLGYGFDCTAPLSIVPEVHWANKNILALIRGCGSYCSVSYYFQIRNGRIHESEREYVFWHDTGTNLIAYENPDNSITIENIYTAQKEKYKLPDGLHNRLSNIFAEKEFRLKKNIFSMKFPIEKDGKEVTYFRKIVLSKKLMSNADKF